MDKNYDFSGWATKTGVKCADGRTILPNAFKDCDGVIVPLVWNHGHESVENVLGHALLKNYPEGVYAYGYFNDTDMGLAAKEQVKHRDITNLSIFANKLVQKDGCVSHGVIRELSLVLAGANPKAVIDCVLAHSADSEEAAIIYTPEEILYHSEEEGDDMAEEEKKEEVISNADDEKEEVISHADDEKKEEKSEKTVQDVFDTLTEEQKTVVYALVGMALDEKGENNDEKGENKEMKHNVFEKEEKDAYIASARKEFQDAVIRDAKSFGSMRESFLAHKEEFSNYLAHSVPTDGMDTNGEIHRVDGEDVPYGIDSIDFLFPEAKALNNEPEFIKRDTGWVGKVMAGVHHTPFSRIKSVFADITEDDARAKGYITGNLKKNEVFGLLKRATDPTTVYKKQKLDRDDIIDITDFNVVAFMKREMRMMLDEELACAFLFGDGRDDSSDDKINPTHIRPIAFEAPLFNISIETSINPADLGVDDVASETAAKEFIRACIRARKKYRGSGNPTLFVGENMLTEMLLLEDGFGHMKYANASALASVLRVKELVPVPVLDEREVKKNGRQCLAVIVNLNDYNVGADKGGEVNMFDDFDIDYNQQKYLIETRCSGALVKPFSAMTVWGAVKNTEEPEEP